MAKSAAHSDDFTYATLCPPPLSIQKKPRRATFRQRILRRSVAHESSNQCVFGPLDDIIDVIKTDLWDSPPRYSFPSASFNWGQLSTSPSAWAVTPLPLSRNPSDRPLTIRKHRNCRSSASESSMGDPAVRSRNASQEEATNGGPVGAVPWPSLDSLTLCEFGSAPAPHLSNGMANSQRLTARMGSQDSGHEKVIGTELKTRRPSRLRLLTNGFPRLRRMGLGDASTDGSAGNTVDSLSSTDVTLRGPHNALEESPDEEIPSDEAVETYIRNNARNAAKIGNIVERLAQRLPQLPEYDQQALTFQAAANPQGLPTTLRAAATIFTSKKVLNAETEEIDVAIDIEGMLHNGRSLPETSLDIIFVVDNGYYVTKPCIESALDAVNGTMFHLGRGDRVALFATHCTHNAVSGNRPDMLCPLRPFSSDTQAVFQELTVSIAQFSTQQWHPVRPNPSMTDVVLCIVRSLERQGLKKSRAHLILLSPASHVLHDVSNFFPDLYTHRINPAVLPFWCESKQEEAICYKPCCKYVFSSNMVAYESVSKRIRRTLKYARCVLPAGELKGISLDIRTKDGCELVKLQGATELPTLRPGQLHTLFARIRVTKSQTKAVNLTSVNPIFNSALNINGSRQELLNFAVRGATKVHLLDVQILCQDSLQPSDSWIYSECPLLLFSELGSLSVPRDACTELNKRLISFFVTQNSTTQAAVAAIQALPTTLDANDLDVPCRGLVEAMQRELRCHKAIRQYEAEFRQRLPLFPGPIDLEASPHAWLQVIWERRPRRRRGVTFGRGRRDRAVDGGEGLEWLEWAR